MKSMSKGCRMALLWFGAGVSIAEMQTGTYFAPLGFAKGPCAIIVGHVIGCALLFFARYVGAISQKSAMETSKISFGAAVELAAAMPISWLPLIADYTKDSSHPLASSLVSAVVYGITSCWMYVIGMGAALFTGESDLAQIMLKAAGDLPRLLSSCFPR